MVDSSPSPEDGAQPDSQAPTPRPEPETPVNGATEQEPAAPGLIARLLPWGSLVVGLVGAAIMDRGPERAPIVAGAALLFWVTLLLRMRLNRPPPDQAGAVRNAVVKMARTSSLIATQSLIQLALFFSLPFYARAMAWDWGHGIFMGVLLLSAGVSLWDPLSEKLLSRPGPAFLFPVLAGFSALNAVLPGFGVANRWALWLAAGLSAAGIPLVMAGTGEAIRGFRTRAAMAVAALALPLMLIAGGARLIPAAPLKLVKLEFGTRVQDHWVADPVEAMGSAPDTLICATAIYAPLGIKEELVHVWSKDGLERARVPLAIRGGRSGGFRTRSRIRHFGSPAQGSFECRVETSAGQLLGRGTLEIGGHD